MPTTREVARVARTRDAEWFIDELRGVSPGNLRALWLPAPSDTTTTLSPNGQGVRTWTYNLGANVSYQGNGVLVSFNGTDQYATTPDTADLSFGNGTADSAFSLVAIANVTDTAAQRQLVSKSNVSSYEYVLAVTADANPRGADRLECFLYDQSSGGIPIRTSDAAITMGSTALFGVTYSAVTGGATAANDITLYQNGSVIASTAANSAGYVAMENTASPAYVGSDGMTQNFMSGSVGFAAVYAANLSAAKHRRIAEICREYYEVKL